MHTDKKTRYGINLVEKAQDFASGLSSSRLLVIHDTESGGQHNVTEATGWQHVLHPLLNILKIFKT
jgi:hypothetical protein